MNRQNKNSQASNSDWQNCRRGQLAQAAERRASIQRRQFLKRSVITGVALMGGATVSTYLFSRVSKVNQPEAIVFVDCRQAMENVDNYIAGNLEANLVKEIDRHLGNCESCNDVYVARSVELS